VKIVFSTDQVYLHGGVEKVLAEKANYFADIFGYEVIILTTEQKNKQPCYPLSDNIKLLDIGINYERSKSYFSKVNLVKIPSHYRQLKKQLRSLEPDLVIVVNYAFDFYWMPFILKKVPKCKEFHSSRYFEQEQRIKNRSVVKKVKYLFNDWIESKYDQLIVLNPDEKYFYHSKNTVVIPNPIPSTGSLQGTLFSRQVLAAGRISPVKGFEKLIEAWGLVNQKHPDWQLHIYGNDYLGTKQKLQSLIEQWGLEDCVHFKGTTNDMVHTMLDYSIYALSSQTECFPMVLLESLSVGLPVVSFDCPTGPGNIITDGIDGFLVEDQNIAILAENLLVLIEDKEKRVEMGNQAKKSSYRFSNELIMKQWENLIADLNT
jgi:glycosyltransferase involved in cell wall biosynthesis